MNRRGVLRYSVGLSVAAVIRPEYNQFFTTNPRFRVDACDWSIGPAGDPNCFAVAKQIGLDGVQISLNTKSDLEHLRQPQMQQSVKEGARRAGVAIGGLAIGLLNEIPYKSDSRAEQWVQDSVDVARALGVKRVLLAFSPIMMYEMTLKASRSS